VTVAQLVEYALLGTAGAIVLTVACAFVVSFAILIRDDVVPALRELGSRVRHFRRGSAVACSNPGCPVCAWRREADRLQGRR
jgi:hypothetical protein